jgi:hypothetical protein
MLVPGTEPLSVSDVIVRYSGISIQVVKDLKETVCTITGGFCPAGEPVRTYTNGLNVHSVT